jgi:hypothetical protein
MRPDRRQTTLMAAGLENRNQTRQQSQAYMCDCVPLCNPSPRMIMHSVHRPLLVSASAIPCQYLRRSCHDPRLPCNEYAVTESPCSIHCKKEQLCSSGLLVSIDDDHHQQSKRGESRLLLKGRISEAAHENAQRHRQLFCHGRRTG